MADSGAPWWGIAWWIWGSGALVLAAVFSFIGPTGEGTPGLAGFWIRWGHSICWLLIAAGFFWRSGGGPTSWAEGFAAAGGLCYLGFLLAWLVLRKI